MCQSEMFRTDECRMFSQWNMLRLHDHPDHDGGHWGAVPLLKSGSWITFFTICRAHPIPNISAGTTTFVARHRPPMQHQKCVNALHCTKSWRKKTSASVQFQKHFLSISFTQMSNRIWWRNESLPRVSPFLYSGGKFVMIFIFLSGKPRFP